MRILFLLLTTAVAVDARCGTGFIQGPSLSDCYKFVTKSAHWYAAEWRCLSLGGHLASVGDAFASSFLVEEIPSCCPGYYWLGGSNDDPDGSWEWSDGTPFRFTDWDARQSVTGSPLCLGASNANGKWSALPCYQSRPYVCKVSATDDVCPTPTPHCKEDVKTDSTCICADTTCAANQYCHTTSNPKCLDLCAFDDVASGTSCQCLPSFGSGDGNVCFDGQICNEDGSCAFPGPTACTDDARTVSTCTCGDTTCAANQYCHSTNNPQCLDTCAFGDVVNSITCQCVPSFGGDDGDVCFDGQICNEDGTCMYPTPPVCTDDARSDSVCTCGTDTCAANQYCHPTNYPKCVSACVSGDVVSGFSCQCVPATGDGDGSICTDGHTCNVDGTCMAPAPPVCTDNARTYSTCTCGTDTCTSTQYCHTTSNPKCIGVCTTGTAVRGYSCQCVPATGDGDGTVCADGQTCKADGTCPATPPPPCTNDAKTDKPCTCDGTDICAATQYCHKTSNPKCINACTSGSFVSGTSCQCVPSSGGGDGFVCTDGHTCKADGTCPATPAAPCANDARAFSQCACGDETCTAYQYCHLNNDPKCLGVCASGSDVKGTSCQCVPATGGGDGTPCTDGQTCSPDGTCPATVADCTDNALVTSATCKCYTDTCNKGQYCHKTSPTRCVDKCAAVGKVTGMSCQCTTQWHVGSECSAGQTCNADGTCQATLSECPTGPPANTNCTCKDKWCLKGQICVSTGEVGSCFPAVCPATGGAPAGGCICGDNGAKCNQDDACTPATGTRTTPAPPTCPTGSPANAVCTCEDTWCVKGQTCTSAGDDGACSPAICPATGGAPAGGCICGDNGVKCNQDDTCSAATGTCAPPAPPACPVGSPVYSVCTCKKIQCVKGQNCDDSGYGMCSPVICQPLHVSAPAGGCICGDNGAKCNQDYTCTPATGTCTPPPACTDDAKTDKPCTCDGTDTCAANQYCHKTSNPKCLGMCVSGGDVQGTPCQCVPATGGGDGTVCTDGQTCEAEGTCPASFTD